MSKQRKLPPWRELVRLKQELRSGELSLAEFAADLHEVTLAKGRRPVYEMPEKFFALTYPTHALRELVKDVALRLAGQSDKAVRQLELTYGGGKTHTLITLYHLFRDPAALPDMPAVREFREHAGAELPAACTAALCFDKIDVEKGIEGVRAPDGEERALRHPWSVLAFQLAGAEGLRAIHADGEAEERETPPAEPLLAKLIDAPRERGLATLILVDEVLMYARGKADLDPKWRERIMDFFQCLTQAAAKAERAALVASLLATDPSRQQGRQGQELFSGLFDVFRRQREEGVQPVRKQDVAEVLRRRFFEPESIRDRGSFRSHVIGVVRGISKLDGETKREMQAAEEKFQEHFPFHPDLTEVFYSRWTQLEGFQRTRGILRTLATALREAERWKDASPLIGPSALLAAPGKEGVSEAVRELAGVATSEGGGGGERGRTDWVPLLEVELNRARQVQNELPALRDSREAEQAVLSVFLHSQPIGHKAYTPELLRMAGSCAPDLIELEKGLRRWRELSWFLDDEDLGEGEPGAAPALPESWRLGNRPNLRQMHDEACRQRVSPEMVEARLNETIRKAKPLTKDAVAAGASVHLLPESPQDVGDDGCFRYAVLGAEAVSESGKPSALAKRFLDQTSGPDRPRVHRNAVVLAVPSRDGLEAARAGARSLLGWEAVQAQLKGHQVNPLQAQRLRRRLEDAATRVADTVRQAYSVVVTVNEDNEACAFRLSASAAPLFTVIKNDQRARIQETPVNAEALLPGGPYDLWDEGEDARLVKDLAGAFARYPRLPKVLNPKLLLDTVLQGVQQGLFVARLARPDGSLRTWWREEVDPEARADPALELVLPGKAALGSLPESLLAPGQLPELWAEAAAEAESKVTLREVCAYFGGGREASVQKEGYAETLVIPRGDEEIVRAAVARAVEAGTVWLTSGPASVWQEPVPPGVLAEEAVLRRRPALIEARDFVETALPAAWRDGKTNGALLTQALSQARNTALPWGLVRASIQAAVDSRWLQLAEDSASLRCGYDQAGNVVLQMPAPGPAPGQSTSERPPGIAAAAGECTLEPAAFQELAERVSELLTASAGSELHFRVRAVMAAGTSDEVRAAVNRLLAQVSKDLKV
ncbi:MAG: DUF499 domain-containing protein [Gammaproteobacteria bacterium]|nr:DUF499 domain-containing protein [Gammaproteobacteria bacterium]